MGRAEVLHWSPKDYLSDYKTQSLTVEEHGAYRLLLDHMWTDSESQYEFPLDYHALASIWKVPPEDAERLVDRLTTGSMAVLKIKTVRGNGVLQSKRLREQADKARIYRERQAEKGRKSAASRCNNTVNHGSTAVQSHSNSGQPTEARKHVTRKHVSACPDSTALIIASCQEAYHDKRWKLQSAQAIEDFIDAGGDTDLLLAALPLVPVTHNQSLRYLIEDGTWQQFAPRSKPKPCTNPACVNGHVPADGDEWARCPECNGGAS